MKNQWSINTPRGIRWIGTGHPTFLIAEMSGNHNQSFERAIALIDVAEKAGVDAIKLQTYTADTITMNAQTEPFQVRVNEAWANKTLYQLYQEATTPWEWQPRLKAYAESKGLLLFSSPFDPTAVDFLEQMDVALYKVASFEVVDIPLLKRIGKTGKPVIMSRGMASIEDIELALETLRAAGTKDIALLHCVSSYPATPSQMNLATIPDLARRFNVPSGLSDHTLGTTIPTASVSLGASIIEKHFTLRRKDGGPDAAFSLEPQELKDLVNAVRDTELAIGKPNYNADNSGEEKYKKYRKSVFITQDIKKGDRFTTTNLRVIRPGQGLHPVHYETLLGQRATRDINAGTPMTWELTELKPPTLPLHSHTTPKRIQ